MPSDKGYIESVQEAVDVLARRATRQGDFGFNMLWCLHLEAAVGVAHISLNVGAKRKDVPSHMRRYYAAMALMVLRDVAEKGFECEATRTAVSARMLRRGSKVKDPVLLQAWRGACFLLIDAGDSWVAVAQNALSTAPIGGCDIWQARLDMAEGAVDATFSKRAKPEDTPILFAKFFSQLVSSARASRLSGSVATWGTAKKNVIDGVLGTDRPTDPVRAAAYTTATLLLRAISDDTSPADQLRYANLYVSSRQASGENASASTVAGVAVAGAAAAAAQAEDSAPGQSHYVTPMSFGGGPPPDPTSPIGSIAFKSSLVAGAFPAVADDLGPPGSPPGLDKCPAALSMNDVSSPAASELGEIGSIAQESDWLEHIASPDDDAAASAPLVLGGKVVDDEVEDFTTKTSDDCAAQPLPLAGVSPSLGVEQPSCTRPESSMGDMPTNAGSEKITNSCGSNGLHNVTSTSSTPTPTAQVAAGVAATAEVPPATAAVEAPSMHPQSPPVSACGTGTVATEAETLAPIVPGIAAAWLGAAAAVGTPPTLAYHCQQTMASFGIDTPKLFQTATGKWTTTTEAGATFGAAGAAVAAPVPASGTAVVGAGNMPPPQPGKPRRGSGASASGSGTWARGSEGASESGVSELSGTNGNAPVASGAVEQAAGEMGAETRPATSEENIFDHRHCGEAFPYGTPVPVGLPATAWAVNGAFAGEGGAPVPVPVPEPMPAPVSPPVAAAGMVTTAELPAMPGSAASGLHEPILYTPIGPFESLSPEAKQAAMAVAMQGFDPVDYLNRKLAEISESRSDLASFLTMGPDESSLLGNVDHVSDPMTNPGTPRPFDEATHNSPDGATPITAELDMSMYSSGDGSARKSEAGSSDRNDHPGGGNKPRPFGETMTPMPGWDAPIVAELDMSVYSRGGSGDGGAGAGSDKKRKTGGSEGNDCAAGGNKKTCTASVAGDVKASTYSSGGSGGGGGGGGGSCNKRKGGSSDGYNYVGGPNKKVCCV